MNFEEDVRSCQRFFVESEGERARRKVFNYAIENLNAKIFDEKMDRPSNVLKMATEMNLLDSI